MSWEVFTKALDHVMATTTAAFVPPPLAPGDRTVTTTTDDNGVEWVSVAGSFGPPPESPGGDKPPPFDDPYIAGDGNTDGLDPTNPPPAGPAPSGEAPAAPPGEQTPGAPTAPPVQPPASGEDSGPAAEAAKESAEAIGKVLEHLTDLDAAGISDEEIVAAGQVGRDELQKIHTDVVEKMKELKASGALYTPEGQHLLMEYVQTRLEEAKTVIEAAAADAENKADHTNQNAQNYEEVGANTGGEGNTGGGEGESGATKDENVETTEAAGTQPAGMPYGAPGLGVPGLGGGLPGFGGGGGGLPGFGGGGGGLPGAGFIDPLTSLAGLAADPKGLEFSDEGQAGDEDDKPERPELKEDDGHDEADGKDDGDTGAEDGKEAGTHAAGGGGGGGEGEPPAPAPKSTEVTLPGGDVVEARSPVGAEALRAALQGAPVSEAYQKAGITLPPAGTPVTEPIPPTRLQAGDVGMWKDHMVMSLGSGKVLVSGQEQPLESVGSGPDFLGWFDPTATGKSAPESV